jgi:N-methylhydantoinase A
VSDANAVLGRLQADFFLGGEMPLDINAANQAVEAIAKPLGLSLEETAQGILDIVNEHMSRALRKISVGKGYDLGNFKLCCFGGAGGLHICALADSLDIKEAIVPVQGGVFSALGLVAARTERQLTQTHSGLLSSFDEATLLNRFDQLAEEGRLAMQEEGLVEQDLSRETSLNLRYQGQAHSLNIIWQGSIHATSEAFTKAHQLRYGHKLDSPVELVDLCVATQGPESSLRLSKLGDISNQKPQAHTSRNLLTSEGPMATAVYRREELKHPQNISGPALICERVSTTWLEPGWTAEVDVYGNLLLHKA